MHDHLDGGALMHLTRVNEPGSRFSYEHEGRTYVGQRGLLVVGPAAWPTVERWNVDTKLLIGSYECEFGWWTSHSSRRWQAIRVLLTPDQFERIYPEQRRIELVAQVGESRARGRIYIHPANHPHELEGCVAPGLDVAANGVLDSRRACLLVYGALGGWEEGKRFDLEVR